MEDTAYRKIMLQIGFILLELSKYIEFGRYESTLSHINSLVTSWSELYRTLREILLSLGHFIIG